MVALIAGLCVASTPFELDTRKILVPDLSYFVGKWRATRAKENIVIPEFPDLLADVVGSFGRSIVIRIHDGVEDSGLWPMLPCASFLIVLHSSTTGQSISAEALLTPADGPVKLFAEWDVKSITLINPSIKTTSRERTRLGMKIVISKTAGGNWEYTAQETWGNRTRSEKVTFERIKTW